MFYFIFLFFFLGGGGGVSSCFSPWCTSTKVLWHATEYHECYEHYVIKTDIQLIVSWQLQNFNQYWMLITKHVITEYSWSIHAGYNELINDLINSVLLHSVVL